MKWPSQNGVANFNKLILISGYPSSGKTYRAEQLIDFFQSKIKASSDPRISRLSICHINDQSLGVNRDAYREARTEKDARAEEYSAVKRALGKDTLVIADGLNYIKGFRYQLYCEAKALQTPSCVVGSMRRSECSMGRGFCWQAGRFMLEHRLKNVKRLIPGF